MAPSDSIKLLIPTWPFLFGFADLFCCAQHQESKFTANKIYHRSFVQNGKVAEIVCAPEFDQSRFEGSFAKLNKLDTELENIIRGLKRCPNCAHYWNASVAA